MFAGLGASRIRKLFAEARKHAPAIVFIDELDAVGAQRTGHGFNREQDQTLNQLLVELDGFDGSAQVCRDGRLEPHPGSRLRIAAPRPLRSPNARVAAPTSRDASRSSASTTRGKPLSSNVDLRVVAKQTSGLTGAELANICNEAAIFAAAATTTSSRRWDFDSALERVVAGLQQRKVLTEKERRILSYHEGGPRADGAPDGLRDGAAEGDDRRPRRRTRLRLLPPRGGSFICTRRRS